MQPVEQSNTQNHPAMADDSFIDFPDLALLELHFVATRAIELPWYHGALWNALFRHLVRLFVDPVHSLSQLQFRIHPVETGCPGYQKDDPVHLGLSFPFSLIGPVTSLIQGFNGQNTHIGKFGPATLRLTDARCRVSNRCLQCKDASAGEWAVPLTADMIQAQAEYLASLKDFSMLLTGPLRLKSPSHWKQQTGHTYLDPEFFQAEPCAFAWLLQAALSCRSGNGQPDKPSTPFPVLTREALYWQDITYGSNSKTLGGLIGQLTLHGHLSVAQAFSLVAAQYTGLGKNRSFGFGFFLIPELAPVAPAPLRPGLSLARRIFSIPALKEALYNLPNSSPGPDGITVDDLKQAGQPVLERLSDALVSGRYVPGAWMMYRKKKKDRSFRSIVVFNVQERIVQRMLADFLSPVAESLLSDSCFAYRPERNRELAMKKLMSAIRKGYNTGVKADIRDFFGSVNTDILCARLHGLFPFDGLPAQLRNFFVTLQQSGIQGLPQGSPLSPVLSNLYLDRFDRQMCAANIYLVRYGDDFVALRSSDTESDNSTQSLVERIQSFLAPLGLELNQEKTLSIDSSTPFSFLGFSITGSSVSHEAPKEEKKEPDLWLPLFREEVLKGLPVYLTTLCRGARSDGPYLVVQDDRNQTQRISWNRVSRIVVVGRSSFSSGVLYRTVKEGIPLSFIDIMGQPTGYLTSAVSRPPANQADQKKRFADPAFCLGLARQVVSAKIHNSHVLLRRNRVPVSALKTLSQKAAQAESMEQLRGIEGSAARMYFQAFGTLVSPFTFSGREFYPSKDPVNAMLSLGYTLLYNRLASALRENGLQPRNGFFHRGGGRHFALASDLMEELRHVIDRIVLTLIHRKEVNLDDFEQTRKYAKTCCRFKGKGFRTFIRQYEETMASQFQYSGEVKMSYNAWLDESAKGLVRAIKLDIPLHVLKIR